MKRPKSLQIKVSRESDQNNTTQTTKNKHVQKENKMMATTQNQNIETSYMDRRPSVELDFMDLFQE